MITKRDVLIFLAGAMAFHTLSHLVLAVSGILPFTFFNIVWTQNKNTLAIVLNAIITFGLLWWAGKQQR